MSAARTNTGAASKNIRRTSTIQVMSQQLCQPSQTLGNADDSLCSWKVLRNSLRKLLSVQASSLSYNHLM